MSDNQWLTEAKARVRDGDTSEEAKANLAAARAQVSQERFAERTARQAQSAHPDDGVAAPEPVQVTTEGG